MSIFLIFQLNAMNKILIFLMIIIGFSGCSGCSNSGKKRMQMERNGTKITANSKTSTKKEVPVPSPPKPQEPHHTERSTPTRPSASTKSIQEVAKLAEPAVFLVFTQNGGGQTIGQGTGFFVDNNGMAVSNFHVFDEGKKWTIQTQNGRQYPVERIIKKSKAFDYVQFKVKGNGNFPALKIASQTPEKGEEILVLGNPKGLESTLSKGIVSSIREQDYKDDLIQMDAAISPGSSGSPVMNMQGEVIGIATLKVVDCERCNFAYNINVLNKNEKNGRAQ